MDRICLFVFLFLDPIYIYSCKLVLSDTLFLGLSLLWVINLIWIVFRPAPWMIVTQAIVLFLTFTIRPSALYYRFIGGIAFLLSRQRLILKIAGIGLPCILVGSFMLYSSHVNEHLYGVKQSAAFQGWKLASNALYIYEHIPTEKLTPVPQQFQLLDNVVRRYFKSRHQPVSILNPDPSFCTYYVFMYPSPNSEDEFGMRVISLGSSAREMNISKLRSLTQITDTKIGSVQLLKQFLASRMNDPESIIKPLQCFGRLRSGYPSHADRADVVGAYRYFNLPYPVTDFATAWNLA